MVLRNRESVGAVVVERVDAETLLARMRVVSAEGMRGDLEKRIKKGDPDFSWYEAKIGLRDF